MRAQELANDLAHQLELVEAERDEAVRERDEALAVVDAVRKVRLEIVSRVNGIGVGDSPRDRIRARELCRVVRMLDEVDGL